MFVICKNILLGCDVACLKANVAVKHVSALKVDKSSINWRLLQSLFVHALMMALFLNTRKCWQGFWVIIGSCVSQCRPMMCVIIVVVYSKQFISIKLPLLLCVMCCKV